MLKFCGENSIKIENVFLAKFFVPQPKTFERKVVQSDNAIRSEAILQ